MLGLGGRVGWQGWGYPRTGEDVQAWHTHSKAYCSRSAPLRAWLGSGLDMLGLGLQLGFEFGLGFGLGTHMQLGQGVLGARPGTGTALVTQLHRAGTGTALVTQLYRDAN